jgi:hypothetical protein
MASGGSSEEVGQQLRSFFERLREEGPGPAFEAWIDKLESEGTLGGEAAGLLRDGDRPAIEESMKGSGSKAGIVYIFWPPGAG